MQKDISLISYSLFNLRINVILAYNLVWIVQLAQVVKLVDTRDLKSLEGNFVPVQVGPGHQQRNGTIF